MSMSIDEAITQAFQTVTRFEVIDGAGGRAYVSYAVKISLSLQDDGRTLKVFVDPRETGTKGDGDE